MNKILQLFLTDSFYVEKNLFSSQFLDLCVQTCAKRRVVPISLVKEVTSNGASSQVFLVLGRDGDSQAQACPRPPSLGTGAMMPVCLSAGCSHWELFPSYSSVYYFHVKICIVRGKGKERGWGVRKVEVKLEGNIHPFH